MPQSVSRAQAPNLDSHISPRAKPARAKAAKKSKTSQTPASSSSSHSSPSSPSSKPEKSEAIREGIIKAARERFSHYGYPKTTIAEIATDCNMSAGNIYRFFKSKLDIAVELAQREMVKTVEMLEGIMQCPYRNSRQRLEDMIFADFRYTYHLLENAPREVELAQVVMRERPNFQSEVLRRELRTLQHIVLDGVRSGEFEVDNASHTALAIHNATLKYRYPQLFTDQNGSELERELAELLTLLMRGILTNSNKTAIAPTQIPPRTPLF